MAVITPDTFTALRRYVGVRLQQGVPIVDADWNELEDVRRFELRAFLKWFVGDGVPEGTNPDAFLIVGTGAIHDFTIRSGVAAGPVDGLRNIGRCLVDGVDVMIDADVSYRNQPLHDSQPGAAALRARFGITRNVPQLTAPAAPTVSTVYLDVFEWLVSPTVDPSLVHPGLGTESCVRMRREWVVRVRDGTTAPQPTEPEFDAGHSYYALAHVVRQPSGAILAAGVTDRRERRLLMLPASLIEDVFGMSALDYRRGLGRPPVSIREAVNALLRGEVPATPEAAIVPAPGANDIVGRGTFFDGSGGLITTFASDRGLAALQVFASRLDLANPTAGFSSPPIQVTTGSAHTRPHATPLPNGEVLIVYETAPPPAVAPAIDLRRGPLNALLGQISVASPASGARMPFAVRNGPQVLVFWHEANVIRFDRYDIGANAMVGSPANLGASPAITPPNIPNASPLLHAVRDGAGTAWVAFVNPPNDIQLERIPAAGPIPAAFQHASAGADTTPFLLVDANDDIWLFWTGFTATGSALFYRRFAQATNTWDPPLPGNPAAVPGADIGLNLTPAAALDADGGIWLFWNSNRIVASNQELWYARRNASNGSWSEPRQLTGAPTADVAPFPLTGTDGALWLTWQRQLGVNGELFFRRLVTRI